LYFFAFSDSVSTMSLDRAMPLADALLAALPFGFFFEPKTRSFCGAGVWAADFLPLLFTRKKILL
jgi:hypothetical protein